MFVTHPTGLNWFYEDVATRIARELSARGRPVRCIPASELDSASAHDRDVILIVNLVESHLSAKALGRADVFRKALRRFKRRVLINYDSVHSHWFKKQLDYDDGLITDIFDINIASQEFDYRLSIPYFWLPETLEKPAECYSCVRSTEPRELPWFVIGHAAKPRAKLIHNLMQTCGTEGFVYVPPLQPYGVQSGLKHLQLAAILGVSDLAVWNSYHTYAYHEGLRALHAVAAGAAPAKIDPFFAHCFKAVPWVYDSVPALARRVDSIGPAEMWRGALQFFADRPSLGESLDRAMARF